MHASGIVSKGVLNESAMWYSSRLCYNTAQLISLWLFSDIIWSVNMHVKQQRPRRNTDLTFELKKDVTYLILTADLWKVYGFKYSGQNCREISRISLDSYIYTHIYMYIYIYIYTDNSLALLGNKPLLDNGEWDHILEDYLYWCSYTLCF